MHTGERLSRKWRAVGAVVSWAFVSAALPAATASAAELGGIDVRMTTGSASGTDESLFLGNLPDARCPAGTGDSFFTMEGPGLRPYEAALGPGNTTGTGPQQFSGASVANLRANNTGSFARSGTYVITFNCVRSRDGAVSDVYARRVDYTAGGAGSVVIRPGPSAPAPRAALATPPTPTGPTPTGNAASAATAVPAPVRPAVSPAPSAAGPAGESRPAEPRPAGQRPTSNADTGRSAGLVGGLVVLTAVGAVLLLLARRRQSGGADDRESARAQR